MINPNSRDLFSVLQTMELANKGSVSKGQKARIVVGLELAAPVVLSISWLAFFLVTKSVENYSSSLM